MRRSTTPGALRTSSIKLVEEASFSPNQTSSQHCEDEWGFMSDPSIPLLNRISPIPKADIFWCNSMRLYCRLLLYFGALISVVFLLYVTLSRDASSYAMDENDARHMKDIYAKQPNLKIHVYMESQCPDTTKFFHAQLAPTFQELGDFLDLRIIPFGKASWMEKPDHDYEFKCQHGPRECTVNQLMCCGIERLKSVRKYLPFIDCVQGTPPGGPEQETCVRKANLALKDMQNCSTGVEGRRLHHEMGVLTKELRPKLFFIPWILVDGVREKRALNEFKDLVCEKLLAKFRLKPRPCVELSIETRITKSSLMDEIL